MSQLSICLFGPPTLTLDGRPVMLDRWKAVALLAYLAVEDRPHRRDGLATLLWPELSQAKARNGLRRGQWMNMSVSPASSANLDWFLQQGYELVPIGGAARRRCRAISGRPATPHSGGSMQ